MSTDTNPNLPLIPPASAALENKNFAFPQLKNIPSDLSLPMLKVFSYGGPGDVQGVPSTLEVLVKRLGTDVHWFFFLFLPLGPAGLIVFCPLISALPSYSLIFPFDSF
jgi:hypothetical protein